MAGAATREPAPATPGRQRTDVSLPRLGPGGWARWVWRQLTSMRTALFLLLLLAIAALPGSIWPQRSINPARTANYIEDHPRLGPVLDKLGFFEVYASPWFSAIYLLLFVSLVGCVLPRCRVHLAALRTPPPKVPARLERLEHHTSTPTDLDADAAFAQLRRNLGRRYRVTTDGATLSAETGYLKETGNILFHLALIGIIVGVAVGHVYGWKGDVIVPVGSGFADTQSRFDSLQLGPRVSADDLPPFTLTVDKMDVSFEDQVGGRGQFGQPRNFTAYVTTHSEPGAPATRHVLQVNHPVELDGASVFLLGNGYAPVVTVRDKAGKVLYSMATPFLARDNNYTSMGAIKVTAARPKQLGFFGNFLPTGVITEDQGPISLFPDLKDPAMALGLFEGDLTPPGRASSVYTLDTENMTQVKDAKGTGVLRIWLKPGQTVQLPGGRGSITLDGVQRWAGLSIRHDPAHRLTLASALLALLALVAQLLVKRRRVFARVVELPDGSRRVDLGALSKTDDDGLEDLLARLCRSLGAPQIEREKP